MPWADPSTFTLRSMLVIDTKLVSPPTQQPVEHSHYEIHIAQRASDKNPTVLITQDAYIYEAALDVEGRDVRVDVAWHPGFTSAGQTAKVIAAFALTEPREVECIP